MSGAGIARIKQHPIPLDRFHQCGIVDLLQQRKVVAFWKAHDKRLTASGLQYGNILAALLFQEALFARGASSY